MRAIRFVAFGDPSVLKLTQAPTPATDERRALVRVMAASVNPSDFKNVAGAMKQTTLPRIPGRDFAGLVEAGPATRVGLRTGSTLDRVARSGLPLRLALVNRPAVMRRRVA